MAQGGWLNTLGERWVRRVGSGGIAGNAIEARAFTAVERPVPAGSKLYLNSDVLEAPGAWAMNYRTNVKAPTSLTISPDGMPCFMGERFIVSSDTQAMPTKLRADGSVDVQCRLGGFLYDFAAGTVIEGGDGTFFCQIVGTSTVGGTHSINILSADMGTLVTAQPNWRYVAEIVDVVRDTISNGVVMVGLTATPNGVLSVMTPAGDWVFRNALVQGTASKWYSVFVDAAGNIYCFGTATGGTGGFVGTLIAKYNYLGGLTWVRRFVTGHYPSTGKAMCGFVLSSGDYLTVSKTLPSGRYGICFARFTSAGAVTWQYELSDATGHHNLIDATHDGATRSIVAFTHATSNKTVLMSVTAAGSIEWQYDITPSTIVPTAIRADGQWLYVTHQTGMFRVPVAGGFAGVFKTLDGATSITFAATALTLGACSYAASTNTTHSTAGHSTSSSDTKTLDNTAGLVAMMDPMPFVATGYPKQRQAPVTQFQSVVGSSMAGGILAMSRDKSSAQTTASFNVLRRVGGAQAVFLGTFCSPPLNGPQWVGEGGDAALYIAESVSNTALNFTAGSPEIYVWRPSTGQRVGTLHQARDARIGVPATTTEAVSVVRFSPLPVYAQDQDIIVFELWGQVVSPGMTAPYTGSVFFAGATDSTTDNATVADFAACIQFSGGNGFVLNSSTTAQTSSLTVQNEGNAPIEVGINEYSVESDPYWADVIVALHMDGTIGSSMLSDLKGGTYTQDNIGEQITPGTMATISADRVMGGPTALFVPDNIPPVEGYVGVSELVVNSDSAYDFGVGPFTIEAWVYPTFFGAFDSEGSFLTLEGSGPGIGAIQFSYSTLSSFGMSAPGPSPFGAWVHVRVCRSGDNFYLFRDGILVDTTTSVAAFSAPLYDFGSRTLRLFGTYSYNIYGANPNTEFGGYVADFRITKACRSTSDFTPEPRFITVDESTTRDKLAYSISLTPIGVTESVTATAEATAYGLVEEHNVRHDAVGVATTEQTGGLYFVSKVKESAPSSTVISCAGPVPVSITSSATAAELASATTLFACSMTSVVAATASHDAKLTVFGSSLNEATADSESDATGIVPASITQAISAGAEQAGVVQMFVSAAADAAAFDFGAGTILIGVFSDAVAHAADVISRDGFVDVSVVAEALARDLVDAFGNIALPIESLAVITRLAETYCQLNQPSIYLMRADSNLFVISEIDTVISDE